MIKSMFQTCFEYVSDVSKGDFGTALGKNTNLRREACNINVLHVCTLQKDIETCAEATTADCSPEWDSVEFGQMSAQ